MNGPNVLNNAEVVKVSGHDHALVTASVLVWLMIPSEKMLSPEYAIKTNAKLGHNGHHGVNAVKHADPVCKNDSEAAPTSMEMTLRHRVFPAVAEVPVKVLSHADFDLAQNGNIGNSGHNVHHRVVSENASDFENVICLVNASDLTLSYNNVAMRAGPTGDCGQTAQNHAQEGNTQDHENAYSKQKLVKPVPEMPLLQLLAMIITAKAG